MTEPAPAPRLLRIPSTCHTVADALGTAEKLNLDHVLILTQHEDGDLLLISSKVTCAEANWLIDRGKDLLLHPSRYECLDKGD